MPAFFRFDRQTEAARPWPDREKMISPSRWHGMSRGFPGTNRYRFTNMKIALFSDSHGRHEQVDIPEADILIFAGDMTNCRATASDSAFNLFLGTLPHRLLTPISPHPLFIVFSSRPESKAGVTRGTGTKPAGCQENCDIPYGADAASF